MATEMKQVMSMNRGVFIIKKQQQGVSSCLNYIWLSSIIVESAVTFNLVFDFPEDL